MRLLLKESNDMNRIIRGDGVHDDTAAIQALLDSGASDIHLPPPAKHYLISWTLRLHSGQTLTLDRGTRVRLAAKSDCAMITNDDHDRGNRDIALIGGIWDMNNPEQSFGWTPPNLGILMRFVNIERFTLRGVTLRDPATFGTLLAKLKYFTVEDITFDYEHKCANNDGIHLEGGCRFGLIRNIRGSTTDDIVAINADDFDAFAGLPIEDLTVDGVYTEHSANGVRIMSGGAPVRNIRVANVHGSFLWYAATLSKFHHARDTVGDLDHIVLRDLFVRKGPLMPNVRGFERPWSGMEWKNEDGLVLVEQGTRVGALTIDGLYRSETCKAVETVKVQRGAEIASLTVRNTRVVNDTGKPIVFMSNGGDIGRLTLDNVDIESAPGGRLLANRGVIRRLDAANLNPRNLRTDGFAVLPVEFAGARAERLADFAAGSDAFTAGDGATLEIDAKADAGVAYRIVSPGGVLECAVGGEDGPLSPVKARPPAIPDASFAWFDLGSFDLFYTAGELLDPGTDTRRTTGPLHLDFCASGPSVPLSLCLDVTGLDAIPADRYRIHVRARRDADAVRIARVILLPDSDWLGGETLVSLIDDWRFKTDPEKRGEREDWPTQGTDDTWEPIDIVGRGQIAGANDGMQGAIGHWTKGRGWTAIRDYHGTAWYANTFILPESGAGCPVWLVFHAVDGAVKVWVNGQPAGVQLNMNMWFKPWALNISSLAQPGQPNRLVVQVTKDLYDAGIWRPVEVRTTKAIHDNSKDIV
jgi:hypothetical protein